MSVQTQTLVQRFWQYCHILRDDGVSQNDYIEQLTYLLFLKMADERTKPPHNEKSHLPAGCDWSSLMSQHGVNLETLYLHILTDLGKQPGMLGIIFRNAQNKIQDSVKFRQIVDLIDREDWVHMNLDVLGVAYESLLEKNAEDTKSGAGQYFTPRALIQAVVDVMQPQPGDKIVDPACGTGGFLLVAHNYIVNQDRYSLMQEQIEQIKKDTFYGWEIVESTARLCAMNFFLHGIGDESKGSPIIVKDSLMSKPEKSFSLSLSNPPFGRKSSMTFAGQDDKMGSSKEGVVLRDDFWVSTSNKQLNFVQHIKSLLAPYGRAAVVIPDNVLFEGGAGERIREHLLRECQVHTLLRLPTGIFYAQGVKANLLCFDRMPPADEPWTKELWVYDLRTNQNFTLRINPLKREHLEDFVHCYDADNQRTQRKETERFRCFSYTELVKRDKLNLDISWLRDESLEDVEKLPAPDVLARSIVEDLQAALDQFKAIALDLSISGAEGEDGD